MKTILLYELNSDKARLSEEYVKLFNNLHPDHKIELKNRDDLEVDRWTRLYGVYNFPAIIIFREDGQLVNLWQDPELPLYDEVFAYMDR